jgi:hypothetical protein
MALKTNQDLQIVNISRVIFAQTPRHNCYLHELIVNKRMKKTPLSGR